jgi:simple sugar transport system permease protein
MSNVEPAVAAKAVTDVDLAKAYIDTLQLLPDLLLTSLVETLWNPYLIGSIITVDWNVNNFGNHFC